MSLRILYFYVTLYIQWTVLIHFIRNTEHYSTAANLGITVMVEQPENIEQIRGHKLSVCPASPNSVDDKRPTLVLQCGA